MSGNQRRFQHRSVVLSIVVLLLLLTSSALAIASPADDWPEWRGILEARPAGVVGDWVVGGRTFTATAGTQLKQEHGVLQVGVCTEVKYQTVSAGYQAIKISSEESYKCNGNGGGDNGGTVVKRYARIEAMPTNGLIGAWTIGGSGYTTDVNTYFEQEHGGYGIGVCVEIKHPANSTVLTKLSTEHDYKCNGSGGNGGGGANPQGELYGVINSFPATLIGQWVIGGVTFTTDTATQFRQEHGAFAQGVMVEVKFYTDANGANHAIKIESKYGTDQGGHDNDGNGSYEGYEGHAYGQIEAMPTGGMTGAWTIGGFTYTANDATRFEQEHGALAVGVNVKVKYYLDAGNNRIAVKIKSTNENGGITNPDHFKMYGYVQSMPANSFNGQWTVNGITFTGDQNSRFVENHGLLAIGAYVELEYSTTGGVNYIHKLETQVPPGAGANVHLGDIESIGNLQAAALTANATWVIGGKSFVVTPATDLNDLNGALTVGATAMVDSYTDANGSAIATQVRSVVINNHLYLPSVRR